MNFMNFLPGLFDFGGAASAAALSYKGTKDTNKMSREMAREQMQFQERMYFTVYQRAVADMEAAGINPVMAYSQGGASSAGGAMGQAQNALGSAVSSARESQRAMAEVRNLREQNKMIQADTALKQAQTASTLSTVPLKELKNLPAKAIMSAVNWVVSNVTSAKSGSFFGRNRSFGDDFKKTLKKQRPGEGVFRGR